MSNSFMENTLCNVGRDAVMFNATSLNHYKNSSSVIKTNSWSLLRFAITSIAAGHGWNM